MTGKWHQVGNLGSEARVTAAGDQLTYDLNFLRRGIWMMIIVDRNSCDYHDCEDHDDCCYADDDIYDGDGAKDMH